MKKLVLLAYFCCCSVAHATSSSRDDSLDNFSDPSALDYTDYVQALQDLKDEGRYIPPNVVASLPSLGQDSDDEIAQAVDRPSKQHIRHSRRSGWGNVFAKTGLAAS